MSDWADHQSAGAIAYGSSYEFELFIQNERPDLSVPEHSIEMIEHGIGWSPKDETPPAPGEVCDRCFGRIRRGSFLWCPKCQDSGFERELYEQRRLAGMPVVTTQMGQEDGLKGGIR